MDSPQARTAYPLLNTAYFLLPASKDLFQKVRGPGHGILADPFFFLGDHDKEAVQGSCLWVKVRLSLTLSPVFSVPFLWP